MAYHLSGSKAYAAALAGKLTPVKGGLHYTAQHEIVVHDVREHMVIISQGSSYNITGTKDGNGYVVTFLGTPSQTYYFDAEVGCKLC